MKQRAKNPLFILALASVVYQLLKGFGVEIEQGVFQQCVDIISFLLIGVGVYGTLSSKDGGKN